ncbi:glycosidase [Candidatus Atribacteria bacterium MT.SAG.1]|nr:glycosidase [Candidatus Atribacteria bacterium MT.SAG.1]
MINMIKLVRYEGNPILSPNPSNQWESKAVFNPAAILKDGQILLLYRAIGEYDAYISRLGLAVSQDGFNFERQSQTPLIQPTASYDKWACEDPRITKMGDTYYITYVALAQRVRHGDKSIHKFFSPQTALLTTKDFVHFKRHGIITPKDSDNRDVVIFPEKINGQFVVIHRPYRWCKNWFENPLAKEIKVTLPVPYDSLPQRPGVWIAYADDLTKDWFDHKLIIRSIYKNDEKTGAGPPPIKTDKGWLLIYHRVSREGEKERIYTARVVLLDREDPSKVIAEIPYDILRPETEYEIKGDVNKVVFPTGALVKDDTLFVYYGAADKQCAVATIKLEEILKELMLYKT